MSNKPNPGDGYRLLEVGERSQEKDELYDEQHCRWKTVVCYGHPDLNRPGTHIRRKIENPAWILTADKLPGPTSNNHAPVLCQCKNGVVQMLNRNLVSGSHVAWMELPEPYVPPKPEKDRKVYPMPFDDQEVLMRRVYPGDPDPDVVLEVLGEMKDNSEQYSQNPNLPFWIKRIQESRSK